MFKEERFVNREDIIKERTTADFCHWVEKKSQEWASKMKIDPDGKELHRRIILGIGLFKDFQQEVLPFCRYLQVTKQQSDSLKCRVFLDSELHYDAGLQSGSFIQCYEITIARKNRHDIRMEKFLEAGRVSLLGSMKHSGTRKTGRTVIVENEFVDRTAVVEDQISLVQEAFDRKTGNRTKNQNYDPNTILLIALDDYIKAKDSTKLDSTFRHSKITSQTTFKSVNIIGLSGKLLLEYQRNG